MAAIAKLGDGFERARALELDSGTEGITDGETNQASMSSIARK